MSDERITDLEMKLSHLEKQFEDLNDVVLEQAEMTAYLKAKLKQTQHKIETLENRGQDDSEGLSSIEIAALEKPPHY